MARLPNLPSRIALACTLLLALIAAGASAPGPRPAGTAPADPSRDTLAWVGARAVTAEDLERRVELMPWQNPDNPGSADTANVRALEALVAEKLLAQEAERQGVGAHGRVVGMRRALARALARDALYRHEVAGDSLRADAVLARVLIGKRVAVDPATFHLLCDSLRARMVATRTERAGKNGRIRILTDDVDYLVVRLAPSLGRRLVDTPGGGLTLEDVLEDLRFYEFSVRSLDAPAFALDFNAHLKVVVERDLLAAEGERQHLDRLPDVKHELETWTDAWRANLLAGSVAAAVPAAGAHPAELDEARARRVDSFVAALAGRTRVRLDLARTQALVLNGPRMLTRRVLGFGGAMMAAPGLVPMWGWAPVWRARAPALP